MNRSAHPPHRLQVPLQSAEEDAPIALEDPWWVKLFGCVLHAVPPAPPACPAQGGSGLAVMRVCFICTKTLIPKP